MSRLIEITRYKMLNRGRIIAKVTLKIPLWGNIVFDNVSLAKRDSERYVQFPYLQDKHTQKAYPYIRFENPETKKQFELEVFKSFDEKVANDPLSESKDAEDLV